MTYVKMNPMRGFEKAAKSVNEFFTDMEKGVRFDIGGFNPRVDIVEDSKNIFVYAEIPGIAKEEIKISINEEHMLSIKGEKKMKEDFKDKTFLRNERLFSGFDRSFILPDNIDAEKISAKYENGLLILTVPKVEPPQPKEIKIDIL